MVTDFEQCCHRLPHEDAGAYQTDICRMRILEKLTILAMLPSMTPPAPPAVTSARPNLPGADHVRHGGCLPHVLRMRHALSAYEAAHGEVPPRSHPAQDELQQQLLRCGCHGVISNQSRIIRSSGNRTCPSATYRKYLTEVKTGLTATVQSEGNRARKRQPVYKITSIFRSRFPHC